MAPAIKVPLRDQYQGMGERREQIWLQLHLLWVAGGWGAQSTTGQHTAPLWTVTHADGDGGATHLDTTLKGHQDVGCLLNNSKMFSSLCSSLFDRIRRYSCWCLLSLGNSLILNWNFSVKMIFKKRKSENWLTSRILPHCAPLGYRRPRPRCISFPMRNKYLFAMFL